MPGTNVLVVDDEKPIRDFIGRNLTARDFSVYYAANGLEALAIFQTELVDLIIMDIMMPHMDGLEACRRIRQTSTVPIIILTALGEESDKVLALDIGADDYLTKPFGVDELLARIRAVIRRSGWQRNPDSLSREVLQYGQLELDVEAQTVTCRGNHLKLTRTEFDLLQFFMRNAGKALPHQVILQQVWGPEYGGEAEYLRVYIGRLRRKVEIDPSNPEYLQTEYGIGYRFGR
ncbi:MAG: response regulator transcription factor [Candidatus Promineifilaceae bacterium]|nr:response regulator transcription factor [Candidatus Promineifilaceae bacterium]